LDTNNIISYSIKRGDKLPPQDQLAAQLGVSRPSLREALRATEMIGAIGCFSLAEERVKEK
jgi:DNA-binding FadR family transcriptional regulator